MTNYTRPEREYVPNKSIELYANTLNMLQQKHESNLAEYTKLAQTIAQLPLNDKENEYKQKLIEDLDTTWNKNLIEGSASFAYDALQAKTKEIFTSPELNGKITDEQNYQKFVDDLTKLRNNNTITDNTFRWALEQNQYEPRKNYTIDSEWKNKFMPVEDIPMITIIKNALTEVTPEKTTSQVKEYRDSAGFVISEDQVAAKIMNNEDVDIVYYDETVERLTSSKIENAVLNRLKNNIQEKQAIEQLISVEGWNLNNLANKLNNDTQLSSEEKDEIIADAFAKSPIYVNGDLTDKLDEVVRNMVSPVAAQLAYDYRTQSNATTKSIAGRDYTGSNIGTHNSSLTIASDNDGRYDRIPYSANASMIQFNYPLAANSRTKMDNAINSLNKIFNDNGINQVIHFNQDPDEIGQMLSNIVSTYSNSLSSDLSDADKDQQINEFSDLIKHHYRDYLNAYRLYHDNKNKLDKNDQDVFDFLTKFDNGQFDEEIAPRSIKNLYKNVFTQIDALNGPRYGTTTISDVNEIKIFSIGDDTYDAVRQFLPTTTNKDGTTTISFNKKDYYGSIIGLQRLLNDGVLNEDNFELNGDSETIGPTGTRFLRGHRRDKSKFIVDIQNLLSKSKFIVDIQNLLSEFKGYRDQIDLALNDINSVKEFTTSGIIFTQDPYQLYLTTQDKTSDVKYTVEEANDEIRKLLDSSLEEFDLYEYQDGVYKKINNNALNRFDIDLNDEKTTISYCRFPGLGGGRMIKNGTTQVFVKDAFEDHDYIQQFNNRSDVRAMDAIAVASELGSTHTLSNRYLNQSIGDILYECVNVEHDIFDIVIGDDVYSNIDRDNMQEFLTAYYDYEDLQQSLKLNPAQYDFLSNIDDNNPLNSLGNIKVQQNYDKSIEESLKDCAGRMIKCLMPIADKGKISDLYKKLYSDCGYKYIKDRQS